MIKKLLNNVFDCKICKKFRSSLNRMMKGVHGVIFYRQIRGSHSNTVRPLYTMKMLVETWREACGSCHINQSSKNGKCKGPGVGGLRCLSESKEAPGTGKDMAGKPYLSCKN